MAHTEIKTFQFGKTLQVKAEVLKARTPDELHEQGDYPYQNIVGITQVFYDKNVGMGDPEWELLEKGTDIGEILRLIKELEKQLMSQKMHNGKLKKRLRSLGVVVEDEESSEASSDFQSESSESESSESNHVVRAQIRSMFEDDAEVSTKEVLDTIDANPSYVRAVLKELCDASEITRVRHGVYIKSVS